MQWVIDMAGVLLFSATLATNTVGLSRYPARLPAVSHRPCAFRLLVTYYGKVQVGA